MVQNLLKVEADPQLFSYRIDNIPLWLLIRHNLIWSIVKDELNIEEPHISVPFNSLYLSEKIKYVVSSIKKNPFRMSSKDVVVFGYMVNALKEGNVFVSRLYKSMWEEGAGIIESSFKFKFFEPRIEEVFYEDIILVVSKLIRQLYYLDYKAKRTIHNFVQYIQKMVPSIDTHEYTQAIENTVKKMKIESFIYKLLLHKLSPKLIIVEDAHYFGRVYLVTVAKKLGIRVAEYQHGYIGNDHWVYNFHPSAKNFLEPYLPDYLLTWGKYWSNSVNTPSKKVEIGHFYLWEKSQHKSESMNKITKNIVVVSSGKVPDKYVDLCVYLKTKLGTNYNLIFRPHPSEVPALNTRYGKIIKAGYSIDMSNLYDQLLPKIDVVISLENTTVLYEAILFTKKVFLVSDDLRDDVPFIVTNMDSLIDHILYKEVNNVTVHDVWEPNPVKKYKAFLRSEVGL